MQRLRSFLSEFRVAELLAGTLPTWLFTLILLLDQRYLPRTEKLRPLAYLYIYGCLSLAGAAALGPRRHPAASRVLFALTALAVAGPLVRANVLKLGRDWILRDPDQLIYATLAAAVLAVAAAFTAGLDASAWGIGFGDWRWWGPRTAVVIALIIPFAVVATTLIPSLREFYPADLDARRELGMLLVASAGKALYLIVEEFFWHGIALFSLAKTHGERTAVLVTSLLYFMMHHSKPELEMASSFPGAILLGLACLRARTFWPAFLVHWPMNLTVDLTAFFLEGPRTI